MPSSSLSIIVHLHRGLDLWLKSISGPKWAFLYETGHRRLQGCVMYYYAFLLLHVHDLDRFILGG